MITCQPNWVSELSSEQLRVLAEKTISDLRATGQLELELNELMEYLEKRKYDMRVTSAMLNTPFR